MLLVYLTFLNLIWNDSRDCDNVHSIRARRAVPELKYGGVMTILLFNRDSDWPSSEMMRTKEIESIHKFYKKVVVVPTSSNNAE